MRLSIIIIIIISFCASISLCVSASQSKWLRGSVPWQPSTRGWHMALLPTLVWAGSVQSIVRAVRFFKLRQHS